MSKEKTEAIFATLERNLQTKGTDLVEKVNVRTAAAQHLVAYVSLRLCAR